MRAEEGCEGMGGVLPEPAGLRRVIDALGVAVAVLDVDGRITDANAAAERAAGRRRAVLLGRSFADTFALPGDRNTADRLRLAIAAAAAGLPQELELRGGGTCLDLSLAPLSDAAGVVTGIAVTGVDAGRRVRAEAEARDRENALRAARDEAERARRCKTRFLAAASHDLRQPAQSLTLFGALLADRLRGHPQMPLVQHMNEAVEAMRTLLDGLLDVSRLDAGIVVPEPAPFCIADLFDRLEADYAPRASAKGLRLRCRPLCHSVHSDAGLLERLLRNLLDNALKYTGKGGILLGCRRRGSVMLIDVVDTGLGMPADKLDEIFEEFVQLGNAERDRSRGLGLGLAVVKRLSRLLNLPVSVRSTPGRGTCFSVEVPLHAAKSPCASARLQDGADRSGRLAMVIDDEEMILHSLRLVLEEWGWDVLAASSGEEAVRLLDGAGRAPDVIVADYRLRHGHTGVEAIHDLHALVGEPVPAIVLTGDTSPERIQEARRSGFAVLHKPVTLTELSARLAEVRAAASAAAD